jgi:hypothetical protein
MPKAVLVVLTQPVDPSRDADYNEWYDNIHLGEVTQVPGLTGARRFKLSQVQSGEGENNLGPLPYLALYEIDTDDLASIPRELSARASNGTFDMGDSIQLDPPPVTVIYEQISELRALDGDGGEADERRSRRDPASTPSHS